MIKEILTIDELAELISCSTNKARLLCFEGKVKASKPLGRWLIRREAVLNFLAEQERMAEV